MRIAVLGDASLTHTARWAGFFAESGHDVLLITFEEPEQPKVETVYLKTYLPTKLGGYLSRFTKVRSILERFKPDIISSLYISGYGFLGALTKVHPFAASCLGSDLLVDYPSSLIHRIQITYALKKADLVTVDAENLADRVRKLGIPDRRILKVYFGIDDSIFHPPETGEDDTGKGKPPVVISTRKLYPIYNVGLLIEAAPKVLEEFPEAGFVVCGDGPERSGLERRARELGIEDRVAFKGNLEVEELARELRRADIYVSTSISDSTSVSLLEAMASGAVPVVSDIEANREWIKNGENGLLFDPRNASALAESITSLLRDPAARSKAAGRNISLVREKGLWTENMKRVEERFEDLVRKWKG